MLEAIREKHRRTWWSFLIRGVLAIVVGILILIWPLDSLAVLALAVAVWALVSGVAEIAQSIQVRSVLPSWWVSLAGGLISCAFGLAALYWYPLLSLAFVIAWTILWLFTTGLLGVYSALRMRRHGLPWGWLCTWGAFSILASAIVAVQPPASLVALLVGLSLFAIASGTSLLIGAWHIRSFAARLTAVVHPSPSR